MIELQHEAWYSALDWRDLYGGLSPPTTLELWPPGWPFWWRLSSGSTASECRTYRAGLSPKNIRKPGARLIQSFMADSCWNRTSLLQGTDVLQSLHSLQKHKMYLQNLHFVALLLMQDVCRLYANLMQKLYKIYAWKLYSDYIQIICKTYANIMQNLADWEFCRNYITKKVWRMYAHN